MKSRCWMKESAQQLLKTQMTACEDSARGHAEPGAEEGTLILDLSISLSRHPGASALLVAHVAP